MEESVTSIVVDVARSLELPGVSDELLCAALVQLGVAGLDDLTVIVEGDLAEPLGLQNISARRLSNVLVTKAVAKINRAPREKKLASSSTGNSDLSTRRCAENAAGLPDLGSTESAVFYLLRSLKISRRYRSFLIGFARAEI